MDIAVFFVFALVYLAMFLGRLPGLALDRTGAALLGAILLLGLGRISPEDARAAVDIGTIGLLFGLMVLSAQFRLAGFYAHVGRRLAAATAAPPALLALLIGVAGGLSALLANDIVCLAMAPVLIEGCSRRGLDPRPFLLALACAANIGSAATLIGNPQNMLIGQVLALDFTAYLLTAAPPVLAGLGIAWAVICWRTGGRWAGNTPVVRPEPPPFDPWQTVKGMVVLLLVVAAFLATPWPREIIALAGAGMLLCSRRLRSREVLGLVDWQLIVLFISLFIVNQAMALAGNLALIQAGLHRLGVPATHPGWLFGLVAALSNLVSNVPAVMLLLPLASHPLAGVVLALSSTLAGNFLVVGSIANIIVIDQAGRLKVGIGWREHARVGVPVTLLSLAVAAGWLFIVA